MTPPLVLDEDQALELLAYLVTAARTQVDEAAEYGPMRLLTAAGRLAAMIRPRASEGLQTCSRARSVRFPPRPCPGSAGRPMSRVWTASAASSPST